MTASKYLTCSGFVITFKLGMIISSLPIGLVKPLSHFARCGHEIVNMALVLHSMICIYRPLKLQCLLQFLDGTTATQINGLINANQEC